MLHLDEILLNCLEDCDSCDGRHGFDACNSRGVEFYGYTRLQQPNDMSTGPIQEQYGQQFRRSLGQHIVNTLGGARINTLGGVWVSVSIIMMTSRQHRHHQDESGSTSASLGCVRSNCLNSQPVAMASRLTYRMVVG
jgi:hypothetical protein